MSEEEWAAPVSDEEADGAAGSESDDRDTNLDGDKSGGKKVEVKQSKAKPGVKAKAKAKGKATNTRQLVACFAARCEEKKAGKSKFCERHRPYFQASQYQAEKTGNLKIHNQVFADSEKSGKCAS